MKMARSLLLLLALGLVACFGSAPKKNAATASDAKGGAEPPRGAVAATKPPTAIVKPEAQARPAPGRARSVPKASEDKEGEEAGRAESPAKLAAPPPTGSYTSATPSLSFTFAPQQASPGGTVTLTLSVATSGVEVFFGSQELEAKVLDDGAKLRVTLPKDATSGYLQLRVNGQVFKAKRALEVR